MSEIDLAVAPLPTLCEPCGKNLLQLAKKPSKQTQILTYCPHLETLVHARLGKIDGHLAIVHWIIEGPVTKPEAERIIEALFDEEDLTLEPGPEKVH